jgi:hypothetical protein
VRIKAISAKDIEPIKFFQVDDLSDVVVIAGPNGVGKSRLLNWVLNFFQQLPSDPNNWVQVAGVCSKLIDAHKASKAYYKLAGALNEDSVAWTGMHPMQPHSVIGEPTDRYSSLAIYLRQAVSHNFIDAKAVPPELRA